MFDLSDLPPVVGAPLYRLTLELHPRTTYAILKRGGVVLAIGVASYDHPDDDDRRRAIADLRWQLRRKR